MSFVCYCFIYNCKSCFLIFILKNNKNIIKGVIRRGVVVRVNSCFWFNSILIFCGK